MERPCDFSPIRKLASALRFLKERGVAPQTAKDGPSPSSGRRPRRPGSQKRKAAQEGGLDFQRAEVQAAEARSFIAFRRATYPSPKKPINIIAQVEGSGVPIGGGALPRPWMNASVSSAESRASPTMNVRVFVLPGTTAPPYVITALPFSTNTPPSGVVWYAVPSTPPSAGYPVFTISGLSMLTGFPSANAIFVPLRNRPKPSMKSPT